MIRAAIHGTGRMAAAIATAAESDRQTSIATLVGPQAPQWDSAIPWIGSLDELEPLPELLIDFTLPAGTLAAARWCAGYKVPLVSGVTGLGEEQQQALATAAEAVPVLWSPNLSLGVNLLADLVARAAAVLGDDLPVTIEDIHHQWKKDAPSGTALMLGSRIAEQRRGDDGNIEYRSQREGEIVGEHNVSFHMAGEQIDLVHRAHDRSIYARGALDAGAWLIRQPAGLYSAADWLSGR